MYGYSCFSDNMELAYILPGESPFKNFDSHQIIFTVCQYQKRFVPVMKLSHKCFFLALKFLLLMIVMRM